MTVIIITIIRIRPKLFPTNQTLHIYHIVKVFLKELYAQLINNQKAY